jgi:cytochrome c2
MQMGGLAALLAFARVPWYSVYVDAGMEGARSALVDQQLAALIMWVPGAVPYVLVALALVRRTLHSQEGGVLTLRTSAVVAVMVAAALSSGCNAPRFRDGGQIAGGDARRGQALLKSYGCTSCHMIEGVRGGHAVVGPPLTGLRGRTYVAGVLPNSPDNLVRWIQNPKAVDSLTAMPVLAVSAADARDIASYLYSIK